MPLPPNDPLIVSIAERVRAVVRRAQHQGVDALAPTLSLDREALRALVEETESAIDAAFLIDAVAALVREWAVDPHWLLTGNYSGSLHREALLLGEDRTSKGFLALRHFVYEQYRKLREKPLALLWPRWLTKTSLERSR